MKLIKFAREFHEKIFFLLIQVGVTWVKEFLSLAGGALLKSCKWNISLVSDKFNFICACRSQSWVNWIDRKRAQWESKSHPFKWDQWINLEYLLTVSQIIKEKSIKLRDQLIRFAFTSQTQVIVKSFEKKFNQQDLHARWFDCFDFATLSKRKILIKI